MPAEVCSKGRPLATTQSKDISSAGLFLEFETGIFVGDLFEVQVIKDGDKAAPTMTLYARVVRKIDGKGVGLEFCQPRYEAANYVLYLHQPAGARDPLGAILAPSLPGLELDRGAA